MANLQFESEIIDVEFTEHEPDDAPTSAALVLVEPAPRPKPPPLFQLPPELDPKLIIETQRQRLDDMLAQIEGRAPAPSPAAESAPRLSPEEFLSRAMAQLDDHMAAMDAALEGMVGHFGSPFGSNTNED